MTMFSFNLIDEPWLLVRNVRGAIETVSMRDLFRRAHEFRGLAGDLRSQDFAVLRVLLAVLYRALDRGTSDNPEAEWARLWQAPELPAAAIGSYLDEWHSRFDLFDPVQPWFQVADLQTCSGETKPVDLLIPDCPIDGGLFSMRRGYGSISPAEAARWLIHCQAYDISGIKSGAVGDERVKGGKGYPIGSGWCGWLGGIAVVGDTLRETLLLNLVLDRESDDDLPIWELPPLTSASRPTVKATGQVSLLTWPQRRVRLFQSNGRVTSVVISNGDPVDYQVQDRHELMTGWRYSEPQTKKFGRPIFMPREFSRDFALWRGISALLPTTGLDDTKPHQYKPCGVLTWSAHLARKRILPADRLTRIHTVAVDYGPQRASWDDIRSDSLAFDVRLAEASQSGAKDVIYRAADRANQSVRVLGDLAGNLAVAAGGDAESASAKATSQGFSALDGRFRAWLADFDPDADLEADLEKWTQDVRQIVRDLGETLVRNAGPAAWVGRTATRNNTERLVNTGQADAWFRGALARALPHPASLEGADQ